MVDVVNSYFGNAKDDTMLDNYNPESAPIIPPKTDHNLFFCADRTTAESFVAAMQARWGNDLHSVIGDPGFADPAHGDFRLPPDSPAAAAGIQSIDTTHVGRLQEPMVQRLRRTGGIDLFQHVTSEDRG